MDSYLLKLFDSTWTWNLTMNGNDMSRGWQYYDVIILQFCDTTQPQQLTVWCQVCLRLECLQILRKINLHQSHEQKARRVGMLFPWSPWITIKSTFFLLDNFPLIKYHLDWRCQGQGFSVIRKIYCSLQIIGLKSANSVLAKTANTTNMFAIKLAQNICQNGNNIALNICYHQCCKF